MHRTRLRTQGRRIGLGVAIHRLVVLLVLASLLRPLGAGGLVLLHQHCDDDVHVHVSARQCLDDWRADHALQHPCEGHDEDHHQDAGEQSVVCGHDDAILILSSIDLAARDRTGLARLLSGPHTSCAAILPSGIQPESIHQRARSPGGLRPVIGARSAVAGILMRNHALLL